MRQDKHFFSVSSAPPAVRNGAKGRLPITFKNGADGAEILIYEQIGEDFFGEGVSAQSVVNFLNQNQHQPVSVRINSPGGFVYDGLTIYNALASHSGRVTVTIEGLAFSAASFIAMAGDHIRMFKTSDLGIHRASVVTIGNAKDHQFAQDWLSTIDEHLIDIYTDRTGRSRCKVEEWLDGITDGTVFNATEAKRLGFCDEIIDAGKSKAGTNRSRSSNTQAARNRLKMAGLRAQQKSGKRSQQMTTESARRRLALMKHRHGT